jgi:predicted ester cyclase
MLRAALVIPILMLSFALVTVSAPPRVVAAQDATPAACPPSNEEENAATALRWHEAAVNTQDLAVIDEIVTPGIIHHAGTFPDGIGPEAVKSVLEILITGFPDVHHTVEQVIAAGDFVTIIWSAEGTHQGEFQGNGSTGKRVTWTGIQVYRFECGRIAEDWTEVDGLGRLQQMGALATPTP